VQAGGGYVSKRLERVKTVVEIFKTLSEIWWEWRDRVERREEKRATDEKDKRVRELEAENARQEKESN
jgi:hypothetical protein